MTIPTAQADDAKGKTDRLVDRSANVQGRLVDRSPNLQQPPLTEAQVRDQDSLFGCLLEEPK